MRNALALLASIILLTSVRMSAQSISAKPYQPLDVTQLRSVSDLNNEADAAYSRKDFARAAELYVKTFDAGFELPEIIYAAASCYARAGDSEKAFAYLYRTASMGYAAPEQAENDADLVALHTDPRWQLLLHALMQNRHDSEEQAAQVWDTASLDSPFKSRLSQDEKVAGLSKFWAEVKYNFAFPERLAQIDWDKLYLAYLKQVRSAKTTYEYYRILAELCSKLHDSHTNVYAPQGLEGSIALHTRLIESKLMVLDVWDSKLRARGILPGMEIVRINGIPVHQYAEQKIAPYQSASTKQDLDVRTYEYFLFTGRPSQPLELVLKDHSGRHLTRTVRRQPYAVLSRIIPKPPAFEFRVLANNVGYVVLNSFESPSVADQFLAAFDKISKADSLILDLRNNGGGNSDVGMRILATLINKPVPLEFWQTRDYKPIFRAWGRPIHMLSAPGGDLTPDEAHHYSKPVIVLISARTFSAAEDVLVAFDQSGRGKLVGQQSAGSTGQPLNFKLPGGGSARVCTWRGTYPDGRPFLGLGIRPQIDVEPNLQDFRAGNDAAVDVALGELKRARGQ